VAVSLTPLIVTSTYLEISPPRWSVSERLKLSTFVWPAARYDRGVCDRIGPGQLAAGSGPGGVAVLDRGQRTQDAIDIGFLVGHRGEPDLRAPGVIIRNEEVSGSIRSAPPFPCKVGPFRSSRTTKQSGLVQEKKPQHSCRGFLVLALCAPGNTRPCAGGNSVRVIRIFKPRGGSRESQSASNENCAARASHSFGPCEASRWISPDYGYRRLEGRGRPLRHRI
jgi:hypothetical protein